MADEQMNPISDAGSTTDAVAPAPTQINVMNPEGNLVSIPQEHLEDALSNGYQQATPEQIHAFSQEQKYGSAGQQAIAGVEGLAQGIAGPLATGFETKILRVKPEDIRGREEVNPGTHTALEAAGFAGSALLGTGEAALLGEAGEAAKAASGLEKGKFLSQVGREAIDGAFQGALMQGGEELSNRFKEDPAQTAETAIAHIGLAGVMGGVFGGAIGAALREGGGAEALEKSTLPPTFVSEVDKAALEAGDFKATVESSNLLKPEEKKGLFAGLREEKPEAGDIRAAAERLGAPVMEGMTSASKHVQNYEDSLINGAPTFSGIRRAKLYEEGYGKAAGAVEEALGDGSRYSKAELGNVLKSSIVGQLEEQNAPIKALYDEIKSQHEIIPLSERSAPAIAKNLEEIQELKLSPSSPEGQLVNRVIKEIENLKTVDDVKTYKSILNRSISPTASSGEKRMASIISDKLTDLEENSIERFAKKQMKSAMEKLSPEQAIEAKARMEGLFEQRKLANSQYKEFIGKVKTLSEQLGKGRVYGLQDALHFIKDKLTPEEVANRLFSKKDSEFLKFFNKEFPEQAELIREHQKGVLREAASKTGDLSPKILFNQVNKLEPEIQKAIFSPEELRKLQDAETYIRAFPKNFNPSGTANMSAMRAFFEHPTGAAIANARDFGIEKFIKLAGASPKVKQAVELAAATVKGEKLADKASKAIFSPLKDAMPAAVIPIAGYRDKLSKVVDEYSKDPDKMLKMGDNNPVPTYAAAFGATSARAVAYLASVKPDTAPKNPLDKKMEPSQWQKSNYNRALDIAQQPLSILAHIKANTLIPQDIQALKAIYPGVYASLSQKLTTEMMNQVAKGEAIPYSKRLQLSMFLGQSLDSTLTPQGIMSIQMSNQTAKNRAMASNPQASSPKRMSEATGNQMQKLASSAQTPVQARQASRSKL